MSTSASHRSGQAAVEFMIIFSAIIAILLAVLWASQSTIFSISEESRNAALEEALSSVKNALDRAYLAGDGYEENITLPYRIAGYDYEINISGNFLYANFSGTLKGKILLAENISGNLKKGENMIKNRGGGLIIE